MLDDSGKLHRAGEHIGTLNDQDQVVWTKPEHSKYKAAVTRWLSDQAKQAEGNETGAPGDGKAGEVSATPAAERPPAPVQTAPPARTAIEKQRQIEESNSLAAEGARAIAAYQADLQDDLDFAARTPGCPAVPKKHPQFGDKTPAYVEWLHQNRPDKWREKFGVKGKGQVPVKKTNDKGVEEVVGYREADMATRKTHLTELVETQDNLGADLSWDA